MTATEIYFAEWKDRIKIGISRDVDSRLSQINKQAGIDLRLMGKVPGDFARERALHTALDDHRYMGEWYKDSPELREIIGRCLENLDSAIKNPDGKSCTFGKVARIIWPERTAERLAEIANTNERTAWRWLSGEYEPPAVVIAAVIVEITRRG
jgi:hypothetical protein